MMSPPAWGWPEFRFFALNGYEDVPTRVGMARPEFELANE